MRFLDQLAVMQLLADNCGAMSFYAIDRSLRYHTLVPADVDVMALIDSMIDDGYVTANAETAVAPIILTPAGCRHLYVYTQLRA